MGDHIKWVAERKKGIQSLNNRLVGGEQGDKPLFICRVKLNGNVYPGKYLSDLAYIPIDGKESGHTEWQAATGDQSQFKWVPQSGPFNRFNLLLSGNEPVRAGFEITNGGFDMKAIYIARALCPGSGMVPGKVSEGAVATAPYRGKENIHSDYEVLVYTGPQL